MRDNHQTKDIKMAVDLRNSIKAKLL